MTYNFFFFLNVVCPGNTLDCEQHTLSCSGESYVQLILLLMCSELIVKS